MTGMTTIVDPKVAWSAVFLMSLSGCAFGTGPGGYAVGAGAHYQYCTSGAKLSQMKVEPGRFAAFWTWVTGSQGAGERVETAITGCDGPMTDVRGTAISDEAAAVVLGIPKILVDGAVKIADRLAPTR